MASSILTKERMASIKGLNRWAWVARSPDSQYMAAGTMAGDVDLSSSSSANLEIFKLDFQSDDWELPVVAKCPSSERFNRLAWGKNGSASDGFGLGLIAGALVDGNIDLWNPLTMISPEATESAFVGRLVRHKGHVRGLEFNAIAPNLLASGAEDGEICIWDLANPAEPTHFPRLMDSVSASPAEISFLSWNSEFRDLLASTSYNGATVVWDQRNSKPVMSFSDKVKRRCSVLQWNPDVCTQLVVASDDDGSPSLKVWDMNCTVPLKEFSGHRKGVIAMSWCPYDDYLLTCAKDFRTICWNTRFGEIVCELPAGIHWNYDVHWYPNKPGVISASSFDGKISIYNIEVILTENTLKKDPSRGDSLANLIKMHESGDYSLESLLEMIASHLGAVGAVDADSDTWKVFSSCFSKLSPGEEDCISSCRAKNDGCGGHSQQCSLSRTPKFFTQGPSGDHWKLRCRWWLTRHFSNSILKSEIRKGDLQLIAYKAACASYMYGEEFNYVAEAYSHLEKENEKELMLIVDKHKQSSFGFYRDALKQRSDSKKYRDYMFDRAAHCSIHEEN